MTSLNKCFLLGNLTRDPEFRHTTKGTAIAEFSLGVNRVWIDEEKRKREEAVFIDIVLWNRLAEIAGEYLKKGNPVLVEGRLQLDSWEDKQTGQKRSRLRVDAENLQLLGSRPATSAEPPKPKEAPAYSRPAPSEPNPDWNVDPFPS